MKRIAFLSSANLMGAPGVERRSDFHEFDLTIAALEKGAGPTGLQFEAVRWDSDADWSRFDAAVIGTTWDYWDRPGVFLDTLSAIEAQTRLFNDVETVRWNMRKTYLRELEGAGAPSIPTLWTSDASPQTIEKAFETLGADTLVVKPQIGAGAWRQALVRRGETPPPPEALPPAEAMIQPFVASVPEEGEYSFVLVGGALSHALNKRPVQGDYRVQSMYGARETPYQPAPGELAAALAVYEAAGRDLLYARVDMVRGEDGGLVLMELEIIEPYLYPEQGPDVGVAYCADLARRLA